MAIHWITFLLTASGIVLAGTKLAVYGEALGKRSGIGQGWIGLLFLATITSIPELTTTVSGASLGAPIIAVGNALGSNLFNIAIIVVIDILLLKRGPFLQKVHSYHAVSGGIAILLTALVILGILLAPGWSLLGISPISVLILVVYIAGVFVLYHIEKQEADNDEADPPGMSLARAVTGFAVCAVVIVASGFFLIRASKAISIGTGLSASFVGAVLVAIVTSLPELSTSIGAMRIGAYDMIVGNLLGSNMFNILTVFAADVAFRNGTIFAGLGTEAVEQLIVAVLGIGLTVIAIIAIGVRSRRRVLGMGIDAALILVVYLASTAIIVSRGIGL